MGNQKPIITGKIEKLRRSGNTIEQIVRWRREATVFGIKALVCFEIMMWAGHATYTRIIAHSYWAFLPGVVAFVFGWGIVGYVMFSRMKFLTAYMGFYLRRYVDALDTLKAEGYDWERITDKNALSYWEFYWAKDLKQFEQSLFDYLRSFRRAEDLLRRQAKWAAANAKITSQLEMLLGEFEINGDKRQEILDDFSSYDNPERRKEVLGSIRSRLTHEEWRAMHQFATSNGPSGFPRFPPEVVSRLDSEEDFRLKQLEKEALKVTSDAAKHYYGEALKADSPRKKIRLFKRALNEDVHSAAVDGEVVAAIATVSKIPNKTVVAEVRYLSLQDFARERLMNIAAFATETDWQMCREIILALARPGQSGGRFNKHYFAEDTVKRMVRRQCNMYGDTLFKPTVFDETVSWLLQQGVLVTKPKVDERTLSLSTRVSAATPVGAEIISMILRLKREMSGLPS
jgi:hypothetical protein